MISQRNEKFPTQSSQKCPLKTETDSETVLLTLTSLSPFVSPPFLGCLIHHRKWQRVVG